MSRFIGVSCCTRQTITSFVSCPSTTLQIERIFGSFLWIEFLPVHKQSYPVTFRAKIATHVLMSRKALVDGKEGFSLYS